MDNIEFLKAIAQGIDPYSGELFAKNDILRDEKVVARLFALALELECSKYPMQYNPNDLKKIQALDYEVPISRIDGYIADAIKSKHRIVREKLRLYLIKNGYLIQIGKKSYRATNLGVSIGMVNRAEENSNGFAYVNVYYSNEAQNFIISHLPEILV